MTSTGHGSPGQPPKNCSRRFCQSWGKKSRPNSLRKKKRWPKLKKKRTRKSQQKAQAGKMWNRWQTRSFDVISEKTHPKPKAKAKAKASPRRLRPNPQSSQRSHPARKAKEPFHFLERVLVSQFDIAMWPFTCAPSRLPTEWSWRARRRTKPFSWKMDGPKQAWSRVRQRVLSVSVWRLASHKALAEARPAKISWPAGQRAAGKTACEAATTVPRPSFACFFSRLSCYIFGQPSCYILVNPRAATWLLKVLVAKWT